MGPEKTGSLRFCVRDEVGIEDFENRSLVLLCDVLRLREIDGRSREVLGLLDGERTMRDVASALAARCGEPVEAVLTPLSEAVLQMERQGIVRRKVNWIQERPTQMNEATYLVNPDVSFRQEDDDGGILFNPDTDALELVNPTAAVIWTFLAAPRTQAEVVEHLCEVCVGAIRAQVEKDVAEFFESFLKKGFIGVVEEDE